MLWRSSDRWILCWERSIDRTFMLRATSLITILGACAFFVSAQECALKVGAWEGYPEEITKEGGRSVARKATVTGFSASAVNQKTRRFYRGVARLENVFFLSIPEGD